jgi:hypothetical protein
MKKMVVTCMVLFVSSFLFSYEYIMNNNPSGFGYYSGDTQITTLTWGDFDWGYYDLVLPAANRFYYYGRLVTHLRICTNGYVCLGFGSPAGTGSQTGTPIPTPSGENGFVAPLMNDYILSGYPGGAGAMYYRFDSNFVAVEWRGVRVDYTTDTAYTFCCVFCSANHANLPSGIVFSYSDVDTGNATYDYGAQSTVGIEHPTGTIGERYSYAEGIITNTTRILFTPFIPIYGSTTDQYLSDGKPDAVVFRPSDGNWYVYGSDGATGSFHFGQKGDVALPGDFDGDGDADECVYRPSNGHWYGNSPNFDIQWGTTGDIPVSADFNGDGKMDIAVWRPNNGTWYVYISGSGTTYSWQWGQPGYIPLPADYDNDNYADIAVYRPANGTWYIRKSSDWSMVEKKWGTEGDIPMPTNFTTDAYSTPTVFRPSNGYWYYLNHVNNTMGACQWGQDGDVPVPGDENAGGITDAVVFRPENGYWYLSAAHYLPSSFQWGTLGDKPRFRRSFLIVSPPPTSGGPDW